MWILRRLFILHSSHWKAWRAVLKQSVCWMTSELCITNTPFVFIWDQFAPWAGLLACTVEFWESQEPLEGAPDRQIGEREGLGWGMVTRSLSSGTKEHKKHRNCDPGLLFLAPFQHLKTWLLFTVTWGYPKCFKSWHDEVGSCLESDYSCNSSSFRKLSVVTELLSLFQARISEVLIICIHSIVFVHITSTNIDVLLKFFCGKKESLQNIPKLKRKRALVLRPILSHGLGGRNLSKRYGAHSQLWTV